MLIKLLIGTLIGLSLARWAMWRRFRCGFGRHGRWHRGPWQVMYAIRALGLDGAQRSHLKEMMIALRRFGTELRFARFDAMEDFAAAASGDTFDRARLEALAQKQYDAFGRARQSVLDHLEALHASLTPEQRGKLRDLLGRDVPRDTDGAHPYR